MTVTTSRPAPHPPTYHGPLTPRGRKLFVVRWPREDRPETRQRFYTRRADAERLAQRLSGRGISAHIFVTRTTWAEAR
jgi:hypothetical protein